MPEFLLTHCAHRIGGGKEGVCYSNPTGTNWNRLEIDDPGNHAIVTYCNVGCEGGAAVSRGGHCFGPPEGCAIGSL